MIKTIPISYEEQAFVGKTLATGLMNGLIVNDVIFGGSIMFLIATIMLIRSAKQKGNKKEHGRRYMSLWFNVMSFLFLFVSLLSIVSKITPIGIGANLAVNISQMLNILAMILADPENWWRYLLLVIPALFLPKVLLNIFEGRSWHFNSIGKIFSNMYAGGAFSVMSILVLWITGKSEKQKKFEQVDKLLKYLRIRIH